MRKRLHSAAYRTVARWLPPSTAPAGKLWKAIRVAAARPLLASADGDVNVEHGAWFFPGQVTLGDRSGIGIRCRIYGPTHIGSDVLMSPEVVIYALGHSFNDVSVPIWDQPYAPPRPVTIEDNVWIGTRAMILPGVTIGTGSVIGAGAVVARDVPPYSVAVGNPAHVVKDRRGSDAAQHVTERAHRHALGGDVVH